MKRAYIFMLSLLLMIGIVIVASFAWFTNSEFVEPDLSGFSISAYFGGGDGSSEDPYQIKNPRHLYNLAWLQYLGYFNKPGTGNTPAANPSTVDTFTQYSFEITQDLNMDGWVLPPIGTSEYPFIGLLNGNGKAINKLETSNEFHDFGSRHPNNVTATSYKHAEIIGFIGAIGEMSSMVDYGEYSISSSANAVANIKLVDTVISSYTDNTLVGIAVGYINGKVEDVGIVNGTINVVDSTKISNMDEISSYTVAGYAEDDYLIKVSNNKAIVINPTNTIKTSFVFEDEGNITGWGGSIAMQDMYNRIVSARPRNASNSRPNNALTYVRYENRYVNIDGKTTIQQSKTQSASNYDTLQNDIFIGTDAGGANGYYLKRSVDNGNTFNYLTSLYKDVAIIEKTNNVENGYKIKNYNGYDLNLKSTGTSGSVTFTTSITANTDSDSATVWIRKSKSGGTYSLYTYNEDDGYTYYLTTTDYNSLTLSTSDTTSWKWDTNYGFYTTYQSTSYYIRYITNQWVVSNQKAYYITDGQGNYLTRSNGNITNSPNLANATRWIFENEQDFSGYIADESNTNYKLYINGTTLTASTNNSTSWQKNDNLISSGSSTIIYDNGWKIYQQNQLYLSASGKYLSLNANGSINNNQTNQSEASLWSFSNPGTNPTGKISTTTTNGTYYLRFNNGTLTTTNNANNGTSWSYDSNGYYYTYNNQKYYIGYSNSAWNASQLTPIGYYIHKGSYYLYDKEVIFQIDSNNNNKIYYTVENTNYYITLERTGRYGNYSYSLGEETNVNSNKIFRKSGDSLYCQEYSYYLYINDSGGLSLSYYSTSSEWEAIYDDNLAKTIAPSISYQSTTSLVTSVCSTQSGTINEITRDEKTEPSVFNYIPLNALTASPYTVDDMNTGYLMAGSHETGSGQYADVRVSQYGISNISTSYNSSSQAWKSNGIYTVGLSGIDYIGSNNYPESKYSKYKSSKDQLLETLKDSGSYVYGLHFMDSSITIDHLVTAPTVKINGETKTNYQMPEDCIDFQLASKGIINFFAGYYFPGNTSFFSLHEIVRNGDDEITAIKHISYIYKANINYGNDYLSADYIYQYSDGTYSGNYQAGKYDLVFNSSWIETPGASTSTYGTSIFYFEIPVNKGEFALGSVDGGTGAYLIYLDIGANAQEVDRTEIRQKSTITRSDYVFPKGIAIIDENTTITDVIGTDSLNAAESAVARFNQSGSVSVTRTNSTTITIDSTQTDVTSTYVPRGVTLMKGSGAMIATAVKTTTSIYSQIQYIDYNLVTGDNFETTIQQVFTVVDGDYANTTSTAPTVKICEYSSRTEIDLNAANPAWKLYGIVLDEGGARKNRSFAISTTQDNSDGYGSERTNLYNTLIRDLATLADIQEQVSGTNLLVFDFDTLTSATNTYSNQIKTVLDDSSNLVMYYNYSGNEIEVTTTNDGGSTIYVTVVASKDSLNNDITFKINSDSDTVSQGDTITLTQTTS